MNSNKYFKYTVSLFLIVCSHVAYTQTFYHCLDIIHGATYNIKYINDRIMFQGTDTFVISSQNDFDCVSNAVIGLPNIRLIDFYPINDREYLIIDDYHNVILYDINAKVIKKVIMTQEDGMYEIRKYKSSTYISGYYGKYYVNTDDLTTDSWREVSIPLPTEGYIHEMKYINDDFFVFGLGIENTFKGGIAITHDGGASWRVDTTGFEFRVSAVEYLDDNHLVAIDNGGSVYYSDDKGITWTKKKIHPDLNHAIDSEVVGKDIYVAGGNIDDTGNYEIAYLFKSIDYGRSWNEVFKSDKNRIALNITKDDQNRLYFTTFDGSVFYTKASVSSAEDFVLHDISIHPNPVNVSFRIGTKSGTERYMAQIRDLTGAVVMTLSDIYSDSVIDISFLPVGIYILHGNTDDGRGFVHKLVKVD
jgi:photosystem II stability/assembly factor-like uncharacterized protein